MDLNWSIIIICAVGISLLLTAIIIPQILHVSFRKRLFDRPNARKVHSGSIPRLGGFVFMPVILVTLGLTLLIPASYTDVGSIAVCPEFIASLPDIIVMLSAMTIMFLTGLYDDLLGVKYGMKFLAQILCAVMLVEAGVYILDYDDLFGIGFVTMPMGKIIAAFLVIYIINGLNLIDGIDGLAAGISVIAMAFYGIVCYLEGLFMYSLLSWTGAASMGVFWIYNVYGSRRRNTKIFMGDIGSLSAGLFIAFLMIVVGRQQKIDSAWHIRPVVLALSPLVLPLLDVVRVFFIRLMARKSPFLPDKKHIHHLMLGAGLSMKSSMMLLLMAQVGFLALNLWISEFMGINVVLIIDVVVYSACAICLQMLKRPALNVNKKGNK